MFILLSPSDLLSWQIWHYSKRLKEEIRPDAKEFLRHELFKLKTKRHENSNAFY